MPREGVYGRCGFLRRMTYRPAPLGVCNDGSGKRGVMILKYRGLVITALILLLAVPAFAELAVPNCCEVAFDPGDGAGPFLDPGDGALTWGDWLRVVSAFTWP